MELNMLENRQSFKNVVWFAAVACFVFLSLTIAYGQERNLMIPSQGAWLGASTNRSGGLDAHESLIGRPLDIVHSFHPAGDLPLDQTEKNYAIAGRILLVSWKPTESWVLAGGGNATINAQIDQVANSIKSISPKPVMLVIYHEPEDNVGTAGSAVDYVNMWHNVRHRFDTIGVPNVIWVWVIMGYSNWYSLYNQIYPGDDYVDWILFDKYAKNDNMTWYDKYYEFYNWLNVNSGPGHMYSTHPYGLAEWGSVEVASNPSFKANYFTDAQRDMKLLPNIKAYVYWDSLNTSYNYRIDTSQASLAAYKAFANDPYLMQDHGTAVQQSPYGGSAWHVPGKIEVEDFDIGGNLVAYYDSTAGNAGSMYRNESVDIQTCSEGGYNIGWTTAGEWLEYTVNVGAAGWYDLKVRTATINDGTALHIECDGVNISGSIPVANTGGWEVWQTASATHIQLNSGTHTLRLSMDTGNTNVNWIAVDPNPDVNGDNTVDFNDLQILFQYWLVDDCGFGSDCQISDLNMDSSVSLEDFSIVAEVWMKEY